MTFREKGQRQQRAASRPISLKFLEAVTLIWCMAVLCSSMDALAYLLCSSIDGHCAPFANDGEQFWMAPSSSTFIHEPRLCL